MVSQMTRLTAATISSLTNLELPRQPKPTSTPLPFCLSYLHYKTISVRLPEGNTRHEILDTERRAVEITSTDICFVDADCEAYATPLSHHFNFTRMLLRDDQHRPKLR